jgi:hypothetical protein
MIIPKWLLPLVAVIAAVSVGVALAFVGSSLASKQVIEQSSGTTTAQVIQPIATGLDAAALAALESSGQNSTSPVTGNVEVALPAVESVRPALNREVDRIAAGSPSASDASSSTESPTPLPDASSVGVTPYVPDETGPVASDPCAPQGGASPPSCPTGLRSVILGLTAQPAADFTIVAFAAPCLPTTTLDPRFADRARVQVTLTSTVPLSYSVHYLSAPPLSRPGASTPHGLVAAATDETQVTAWNLARERDVPVNSLPALTACATVPNVWADARLTLDVTGTAADGTTVVHHLVMNPAGPGTPGPLRVKTFGSDAFVAYGEAPPNQTLRIQAYTLASETDGTCDDVRGFTTLNPVYGRTDTINSDTIAQAGVPSDYTKRTAAGFRVPVGSVILLCGGWYNGTGSASYDRLRALRTSQIFVESPALRGLVNTEGVYRHIGNSGHNVGIRGDIARVRVFANLDDGTACGDTYEWVPGFVLRDAVRLCDSPTNESFSPDEGGFTDAPQRADVNVTIQVIGTNGARARSVFRINLERPVCAGCTVEEISRFTEALYQVSLPDPYSNPLDPPGSLELASIWGHSGTGSAPWWQISPPENAGEVANSADSPPRPNTDARLVVDGSRTTAADLTARLDFSADKVGSYELTVHGGNGGAPCTVDGSTSVTVTGSNPVARAVVPIYVPHLCHGAAYLATLTTIEGDRPDTTVFPSRVWGYHGERWSGLALLTPWVPVTVQYTESVAVPAGSALTDLSMHLASADLHPSTDLFAGCASEPIAHTGSTAMVLGTRVQLHLQYRLRHITSPPGQPCTFPVTDVAPTIDVYPTIDLNAVMANPAGVQIQSGPYTVVLKIAPAP